jgi:hypothetical protein
VRESFTGANGTFVDTCEEGNLIAYSCEYTTTMGPRSDPAIFYFATGNVTSKTVARMKTFHLTRFREVARRMSRSA